MTAAAMVRAPLTLEGLAFWEELITECDRYTAAINGVISAQGLGTEHLLDFTRDRGLHIRKCASPSASTSLAIEFFSWGPVIRGKLSGREQDSDVCLKEWEVPLARDLDGTVVAIFDEGRSFSPEDLARYVIQGFRCYYPALSLPYHR